MPRVRENSDDSATTPTGPSFHPFHCSPTDDVVLRSSDGTLFRTTKFRLSRASKMFADMFQLPPQPSPSAAESEPLDIPFDSTVVCIFLNQAAVSKPYAPKTNLPTTLSLIECCEMYDAAVIQQQARARLLELAKNEPRDVLKFASQKDDVELGKAAMAHLRSMPTNLKVFDQILDTLSPMWKLEIFMLGKQQRWSTSGKRQVEDGIQFSASFSDISARFNPGRWKNA